MPRFLIGFVDWDDQKLAGSEDAELSLDEGPNPLGTQLMNWEEHYFDTHNEQLIMTKTITALEDIPKKGIKAGMVVWRDWADLDLTTNEGRLAAINILKEFKPAWQDHGPEYGYFLDIIRPEPWEVGHDHLSAEDGYLMPK